MPQEMLESLLKAFTAKVVEHCELTGLDIKTVFLSVEMTEDGLVTDSNFTGPETIKPSHNKEQIQASLAAAGMEFMFDLAHELEAEATEA